MAPQDQILIIAQSLILLSASCRFDDFDDAIDEAIEEDIRDLCDGERGHNHTQTGNLGNRVDVASGRAKDFSSFSEETQEGPRAIRNQPCSALSRKRRRFNDLESDSTPAESEDEFLLSNR